MRPKRKPPQKTYRVALEGELEGFELVMRGMSGADLIATSSGDLTPAQIVAMVKSHTVEHNFDVDDILELDAPIVIDILNAWVSAIGAAAVPPESATS